MPGASGEYAARQVFDLPEPRPLVVTEHRAFSCRCEACGATTRAAFPEDVRAPAQDGVRIAAFAVYLLHYQLLPEDRLVELMADLFGVKLAAGTIAAMSRNCAGRLRSFAEALRDLVAKAPVKHMDETGFRIGGKTQWLHVACTTLLTFYRTCAKAGDVGQCRRRRRPRSLEALLYDAGRVACALQRPPPARTQGSGRNRERGLGAPDAALAASRLSRRPPGARTLPSSRTPIDRAHRTPIRRRVAQGLAFHEAQNPVARAPKKSGGERRGRKPRRTGHNLLLRLQTRKEDTLRFLHDPAVSFTNNEAERDGRMMKVKQKISGGFRTPDGAADFATLRSVISTARKQGWNLIETLMATPTELVARLRFA